MEGDKEHTNQCTQQDISIHSLRMEGDLVSAFLLSRSSLFQSTPSAWRETTGRQGRASPCKFQSTPSAWRETAIKSETRCNDDNFNPLPPHGGRPMSSAVKALVNVFQSTPSAWRETCAISMRYVSIRYFNPLPPHGGRPDRICHATGNV